MDFTVTQKGLEEQLLGRVIGKEQKALEEQLSDVLEEVNSNTKVCPGLLDPRGCKPSVIVDSSNTTGNRNNSSVPNTQPMW